MPKYDPSKQYKWEETDEFVLTGDKFGLVLNAFRRILAKEESQTIIMMARAEAEMTKILEEGVESGKVKEIVLPANLKPVN